MTPRHWSMVGSASGVTAAVGSWVGLARILPVGEAAEMPARLGLACAALLPTVCLLNLMIAAQMGSRATTEAVDPLAGIDGAFLRVNQRVLTNTVEQLAGFAPALLALAAGVSAGAMAFIIAAGLVFALARLVFWGGYLLDPLARSPGMAATFTVNLVTLGAAIWVWWP